MGAKGRRFPFRIPGGACAGEALGYTVSFMRIARLIGKIPGAWLALIVVVILACILAPQTRHGERTFPTRDSTLEVVRMVSEQGILAIGMTIVIVSAGIDLSVGSILALATTLSAFGLMTLGWGAFPSALLALAAGLALGLANGCVITYGRIQPFVVTLAMMSVARGLAKLSSGNRTIQLPITLTPNVEQYLLLDSKLFGVVPVPAVIFVVLVVIFEIVMSRTSFGRTVYSVGGNEEAARLAGVNVRWVKIAAYTICGGLAALGGVIECAQLRQGDPNTGVAFELDAIAAAVIGGTNLMGGRGRIVDTLAGALIMGIITTILNLHNVDSNVQLVVKGVVIVLAVLLQRVKFVKAAGV